MQKYGEIVQMYIGTSARARGESSYSNGDSLLRPLRYSIDDAGQLFNHAGNEVAAGNRDFSIAGFHIPHIVLRE